MEIFRKLGSWLFLIGILVAVIVGLIVGANWYTDENLFIAGLLAALGFVVGILSYLIFLLVTRIFYLSMYRSRYMLLPFFFISSICLFFTHFLVLVGYF